MSKETPSLPDTAGTKYGRYFRIYLSLLGSVPREYQKVFVLKSSSSILQDELEIYNNKERTNFRSKKSSKTRKDSIKLLRKSIESRSPEEEKVSGICHLM